MGGCTELSLEKNGLKGVNAAVAAIGVGPFQLIALMLGGGIFAAEGALLLSMSLVARGVIDTFTLTPLIAGTMTLFVFAGITLGTVFGGVACDYYGRRGPILVTYAGSVIFLVCIIYSQMVVLVFLFKFCLGVCLGFGLPAANAYVCECCPPTHRANIYSATMILFALGQMYAAAILWILTPDLDHKLLNWRVLLGIIMLPPFLLFCLSYAFLVESPYWLAMVGRFAEARKALLRMAYWNHSSHTSWGSLMAAAAAAPRSAGASPDLEARASPTLPDREDQPLVRQQSPPDTSKCCFCCPSLSNLEVWRILQPPYKTTTLIMCYVSFASNFGYYGMVYGLPRTLQALAAAADSQQQRLGKNPEADGLSWSPAAGVFFSAVFEIPGVFLAMILGLTIGRKTNLCFSFLSAAVCLWGLIFCLAYDYMEVAGLCFVFGTKLFIASSFIIVFLYLLECYPTACRASGLAFCMVIGRLGAFATPFLFDALFFIKAHNAWFFFFMTVAVSIAGMIVLWLPFETKEQALT